LNQISALQLPKLWYWYLFFGNGLPQPWNWWFFSFRNVFNVFERHREVGNFCHGDAFSNKVNIRPRSSVIPKFSSAQ
jgi:hypothetical protein